MSRGEGNWPCDLQRENEDHGTMWSLHGMNSCLIGYYLLPLVGFFWIFPINWLKHFTPWECDGWEKEGGDGTCIIKGQSQRQSRPVRWRRKRRALYLRSYWSHLFKWTSSFWKCNTGFATSGTTASLTPVYLREAVNSGVKMHQCNAALLQLLQIHFANEGRMQSCCFSCTMLRAR